MFQIFRFFSNNKVLLLFLFLEIVALISIFRSHSFHQSKFLSSSNTFVGYLLTKSNNFHHFFKLKKINRQLIDENVSLKNELELLKQKTVPPISVQTANEGKYSYINATVINNSFLKKNNIITLDKGTYDGIKPNMGVILPNGIIGITLHVSQHFCTVLTMLNSHASFNVKLKKNHHFGSLKWDGISHNKAQLWDIPIQADIEKGDTIVSGGHSIFFPDQIPLGVVDEIQIKNNIFEKIDIELFVDFSALNNVYIVTNKFQQEQLELESKNNEAHD